MGHGTRAVRDKTEPPQRRLIPVGPQGVPGDPWGALGTQGSRGELGFMGSHGIPGCCRDGALRIPGVGGGGGGGGGALRTRGSAGRIAP